MDKSETVAVNGTLLSPRTFVTMLRVLWVALGVVMGFTIASAGDEHTKAAGFVSATGWWLVVAVVVVALVVPSALGLTLVRLVAPFTITIAVAALILGASGVLGAIAVALAAVVALVAMSGEVGEGMVQGSAYGKEHRFPLRPPAALLLPLAVSWMVWAAAMLGAVLLLGAEQWLVGIVVTTLASGLTWLLFTRSHRLSMRWLVLVPAGLVVHDPVVMGETLMVPKGNVAMVRMALADTQAADLTGPAAGVALDIAVHEMVLAVFAANRTQPKGKALHVQSFLVAPTRPGRALHALTSAGIPVA
jgi:subtilisin family serine protease